MQDICANEQSEMALRVDAIESGSRFAGLIELLLKDQTTVDHISRDPARQRELVPRLLGIGLGGYVVFGVALSVLFGVAGAWPELSAVSRWLDGPSQPLVQFGWPEEMAWWRPWLDGSAYGLIAAFSLGLIGSIGVCLPSFYFYGLLAGVRTNMLHVTLIALKGMASGAIALIGVLPIYFAIALGMIVFQAREWIVELLCYFGFALPFIAGLWGTRSLYIAFVGLADTMREEERCRRTSFLRRLLISWSICFTAVTPVMIYTLLEWFQRR